MNLFELENDTPHLIRMNKDVCRAIVEERDRQTSFLTIPLLLKKKFKIKNEQRGF
jgi:hypothetical protein